jgi:hypothetical protein
VPPDQRAEYSGEKQNRQSKKRPRYQPAGLRPENAVLNNLNQEKHRYKQTANSEQAAYWFFEQNVRVNKIKIAFNGAVSFFHVLVSHKFLQKN